MNAHETELVQRLRDPKDDGYIGEVGQSVRCRAASYIEHLAPTVDKYLAAAIVRPLKEYRGELGSVLWWRFPITEPPYCGTPNDTGHAVEMHHYVGGDGEVKVTRTFVGGWPGYHTHWTPLIIPEAP